MPENIYKRLAKVEALANAQKAEMDEVLISTYTRACEQQNEEETAELVRKIRNKLLDSSDKEMSLDRLELDISSATKFIASIAKIFTSEWAKYRQALRDLPQQAGFPFNVQFPTPPNSVDDENNL